MYSKAPAGPGNAPLVINDMSEDKLFRFTRELVDLESTSGHEAAASGYVAQFLAASGFEVETWDAEPGRPNVFATAAGGTARVVLSTHLDTVPPFFPSSEDANVIRGRGACDAKGICAAQVFAALELARRGVQDFGLLFLVGEERNSAGAIAANQRQRELAPEVRYLINGEPTESRLIRGGKGVLRMLLRAHGRAAHSAYPELGESAIDKLIEALFRLRGLELPQDPDLGAATLNIGTIAGGRASNVIADLAEAEVMFRTVGPAGPLQQRVLAAVQELVECQLVLELPPITLETLPGFATGVVAFGTDIPQLRAW
ncbi:MAG: M20/M25/M40 family metallo-hydrolase, partial [Terriglobales bacterium]